MTIVQIEVRIMAETEADPAILQKRIMSAAQEIILDGHPIRFTVKGRHDIPSLEVLTWPRT